MSKELIEEARSLFGNEVVNEVLSLVQVSDADGVYSMMQDMGMDDHAECVEFLYFQ